MGLVLPEFQAPLQEFHPGVILGVDRQSTILPVVTHRQYLPREYLQREFPKQSRELVCLSSALDL